MEEQKRQGVASHSLESEFVSYEQAVALKELGFDEEVFQRFTLPNMDDFCKHPLKQQVFRWFRENYELYYTIEGSKKYGFAFSIYSENDDIEIDFCLIYPTYEEAENACIDKLIKLAKQQYNGN